MADGKVVISTALDNSGIEKGAQQMKTSLRSQAAKLAAEYRKQGMSMSDAMTKAWSEIERTSGKSSQNAAKSLKANMGGGIGTVVGKLGGLANVVAGVAAGIAAAFSAAAVAVGAVTKQAVDAYADYEQLTGGVETLFKNASDKVIEYAEDAFYTVGMSANEYMETVTGFSASLISALGGDTAKAADVANTAMTDMADNANKMGTSLESIKTAYQGFAKQNYTMLDNLKLGYGGTKTEMERLLKDAQAITGVKYDINNLADVYNAIHAIQQKLGIAGATALEAEKTISGSAKMTKAAWKNVLAAISGGGDLDKAVNNLVYSLTKYFDNMVPVVQRSLVGVGQLVEKIAPMLVQNVATALIKALPSLINAVYQMLIGLAQGIYQGIAALFSGQAGEISKQLNNENGTDAIASGFDAATESAEDTEKAAKKVKKTLAGFDEIQKIGGEDEEEDVASLGAAVNIPAAAITVTPKLEESANPLFKAAIDKIRGFLEPLNSIDFLAAKKSIFGLGKEFRDLADSVGSVFGWAWFNILVPFSEWYIEDYVPASFDALSSAIETTSTTIDTLYQKLDPLWQKLKPVFAWIGDTVITILNDFKEIGKDVAQTWEDNSGKLEETFENIGIVVEKVWAVIGPVLTYIRNALSTLTQELPGNELQHIIDQAHALSEVLAGIFTLDGSKILSGFGNAIEGEFAYAANQTKTFVESLGVDLDSVDQWISDTATNIGDCFSEVQKIFAPLTEWFEDLFGSISDTANDVFYNIGVAADGCRAIIEKAWGNAVDGAKDAWKGIKEVFSSKVAPFFKETFEKAWQKVVAVFSPAGEIFVDIKDGVSESFKKIVNGLIRGLNNIFRDAFSGINTALGKVRDFQILGITPFSNLRTISVPQIPYLAQGAVLPPNKPFLAMVGDQRHGTNVEAPLSTIQEAVALVMEDLIRSNIAGHEATVAVLKDILEAILGIEIGDDVIGQAVERYNSKMAIIRGGA